MVKRQENTGDFGRKKGFQHKEKKDSIVNFNHLIDKKVLVNFVGGREVIGILKGYDAIPNLILDEVVEILKDSIDETKEIGKRELGLIIVKGTSVANLLPLDDYEAIENPFN